ncbi:MAG: DNA gyrase subunit A [Acidaminococcaceae bacterium]|jgi:DNA gyrase subunit A|nr:DNA gyrase subunit A [Acidaminococcaceae bacterium]MBQ8491536.1 DNA gyrase subunit A [Acidaminococcaceae bacterium]MBQ9320047.1 DNA gyrase subunit A [Acidaminococcaceae bacterium]
MTKNPDQENVTENNEGLINDDGYIASGGKIEEVDLTNKMKDSYINYAMSVIVQRALPDVRDGLKPVHRRILYAMQEAGMTSNRPYKKSARIVGEVLGKYHPHGDSSVYDATVRLAQDFNTRYLLVDGHGNFGSVDGDSPAAMRYTEVRMTKMAESMLEDIEKDTVEFVDNYDASLKEPSVLPAKIPALLVNGSAGIAVGMATNIPPHNLREVVKGITMLIDNPDVSVDELMSAIKGPDFPTGAMILGNEGIRQAYATGRGIVKVRAKAEIEPMQKNKHRIVVTEIPYQVNKARLLESIAGLVKDGVIEGITDLRDESDRRGMRVVVELRADVVPDVILNKLYKHTQLQDSFGIIMLALVDNKPKILNLKQILECYVKHQKDVVTRRTRYDLAKAKERAHILEGLKKALDHLDEVIQTIRSSANGEIAKASLMEKFDFSDRQAQAILDMRLQRLTGLERKKIDDEYVDILQTIDYLESVLADEQKVLNIIKKDLQEKAEKFGDDRRTDIVADTGNMDVLDLIADEEIVITLSNQGYIKRQTPDNFRKQRRGGMGKHGGSGKKEDDFTKYLFLATTHNYILFFTNKGQVYTLRGYQIPEAGRTAKGSAIINLLQLSPGEKITAVINVSEFDDTKYLFMATNQGTVKRTKLADFSYVRKSGLKAIVLNEDEELISVKLTDGNSSILMATREGQAIHFSEEDVRCMGRGAHGVRGINLGSNDRVVAMDAVYDPESEVLTVTENGKGKRTKLSEYTKQTRGGKGRINYRLTPKTGLVAGMTIVHPNDELYIISAEGIIIRMDVNQLSNIGRATQGNIVITLKDGDKVTAIATVESEEEIVKE